MNKIIILMLLLATTALLAQENNDDLLQEDLVFENPYNINRSVQEQEELIYQYSDPDESYLTEEEAYEIETEYND